MQEQLHRLQCVAILIDTEKDLAIVAENKNEPNR